MMAYRCKSLVRKGLRQNEGGYEEGIGNGVLSSHDGIIAFGCCSGWVVSRLVRGLFSIHRYVFDVHLLYQLLNLRARPLTAVEESEKVPIRGGRKGRGA